MMGRRTMDSFSNGNVNPNSVHQLDVEADYSKFSIRDMYTCSWRFHAMKPIFWAMKFCGLFITRDYNPEHEQFPYKKVAVRPTGSWIYSTIILLLSWVDLVRYFMIFNDGDGFTPDTFQKVVCLLWAVNMTVNISEFYRACMVYTSMPEVFIYSRCLMKQYQRLLYRKSIVVTGICTFIILCNVTFAAYVSFSSIEQNFFNIDWPLSPSSHSGAALVVARVFFIVTAFFRCCFWVYPAAFTITLGFMLRREFEIIQDDLKLAIQQNDVSVALPKLRKQFQLVCTLVDHADDILCRYLAVCMLFTVAELILIIYNFFYWSALENPVFLVSSIFWVTFSVAMLAIICMGPAHISAVAHNTFSILHEITLTRETSHLATELNMFMHRLTGDTIGLTAWKAFVIDQSTSLTVIGMLVSYLIILLQSQPSSTKPPSLDVSALLVNISHMINASRQGI